VHVITERTAKRYKAMQLFGMMLAVVSLLIFIFAGAVMDIWPFAIMANLLALLGVLVGLVTYLVGRILAWWHHG
jgi:hypothetical protein